MLPEAFGKYKILRRLGQGGMATVYQALDPRLDRPVAVKVIHPHLAQEGNFAERFRQEARLVASLRHAHIVQVHEFDEQDGQHFMVMEFLPGGTLKERLRSLQADGQRIPLGQASTLLEKLAAGLDYAHQRGAVHRDIKPANVLFTEEREPVITDFGIAKILSEAAGLSATGALVGTPAYMSPEQAAGEPVEERSDIYSLGIMVFEMVTGRVPYTGETPSAIVVQHLTGDPPPPRQFNQNIPGAVQDVILRALARKPSDRYETAQDFSSAFRAAMLGEATGVPADDTLSAPTEIGEGTAPSAGSLQSGDSLLQAPTVVDRREVESEQTAVGRAAALPADQAATRPAARGTAMSARRVLLLAGWAGLVVLFAAAAIGAFAWWSRAPEPPEAVTSADAWTILVADFGGSAAGVQVDFARRIFEQLEHELSGQAIEVQVQRLDEVISSQDAAQSRLAEQGALMLIWGWYDDIGVSAHVEITEMLQLAGSAGPVTAFSLPAEPQAAGPESLAFLAFSHEIRTPKIGTGLDLFAANGPEQMAYVASAVLAFAFQTQEEYQIALELYDQALDNLPAAQGNSANALDQVYFYRAVTLTQLERIAESIASLEEAARLNPDLFEAHFNLAVFYPLVCDPARPIDRALAAAGQAVRLRPEDPAALNLLASLQGEIGAYAEAIDNLQKAIEQDAGDPTSHHLLGDLYSAQGQEVAAREAWEQAVGLLESGLASSPDPADDYLSIGDLHHKLGRLEGALQAYQMARELDPSGSAALQGIGSVYLASEDLAAAEQTFEEWAALEPESAAAQAGLGRVRQAQGQWEQALEAYMQASELNPCDALADLLALGIYWERQDYAAAESVLRRVVAVNSADPVGHYLLGASLLFQEQAQAAIPVLEQALALNPDSDTPRHALGSAYYETGQYEMALMQWQILAAAYPDERDYQTFLGNAYDKLGQWEQAIVAYQRSLELAEDPLVWVYLGLIYQQRLDLDNAIAAFESALALAPEDALAQRALADGYAQTGRLEQAVEAYQQAQALEETAAGHAGLGAVYARQSRLSEAAAQYEAALALGGPPETYLPFLALLYASTGQLDQAEAAYQQLLELIPGDPATLAGLGAVSYKRCDLSSMTRWYGQALAAAPQSSLYRALDALAAEANGSAETAARQFESLLESAGQDGLAYLLAGEYFLRRDDLERARVSFLQALAGTGLSPAFTALAYFDLGLTYQLQGDFDQARSELETALKISPALADAYLSLGDMTLLEGNLPEARGHYEAALPLLAEYGWQYSLDGPALAEPVLRARLGAVASLQGESESAAAHFDAALALADGLPERFPDWAQAHLVAGMVQAIGGEVEASEAAFAQALACDRSLQVGIGRFRAFVEGVGD